MIATAARDHAQPIAGEWRIGSRAFVMAMLAIGVAAAAARALPADVPSAAAIRVALASVAVGTLPGAILLMACAPSWTEIELLGLGSAVSFVLVQFVTIGAVSAHWGPETSLAIVAAVSVVLLARIWRAGPDVRVSRARLALIALFVGVAGLLYVQGAPYSSSEDQIHVAVIRRLAFLQHPQRDDLYFVSGAVKGFYPYPFPAIHYLIALMSRVADLDTLFVYHKLRAFWSLVTFAYVYLAADVLFGAAVGLLTTVTAVLFVLSGTFANSYNYFWGQLTPYSHASDVAMGVLLPALIVMTLRYAVAPDARERAVFAAGTLAMTFMLCIVHTREVIQQCVYCGCLVLACLATRDDRRDRLKWAVALLVATVVLAGAYELWHRTTIGFVTALIDEQRARYIDQIRHAGWFDRLIGQPQRQMPGAPLLFAGWNPWMLLLSPVVLLVFRDRLQVRFVALSVFVYLLIVRFPAFGIPYTLASYFEIQVSSVRNFVFFIHLYTGVILLLFAAYAAQLRNDVSALVVLIGVAALVSAWRYGGLWLFDHQDALFIPLIAVSAAAIAVAWRRPDRAVSLPLTSRTWAAWAVIVVSLAILTFVPGSVTASNSAVAGSPLTAPYAESVKTPADLLAIRGGCVEGADVALPFQPEGAAPFATTGKRLNCPPPTALIRWANHAVPAGSIVAASKFNEYPISVYIAVRIVTWPSTTLAYHDETMAFPAYYELYRESLHRHRAEPFFNAAATPQERHEFLRRLGVTHVLVDPGHAALKPALDATTELKEIYDADGWTMYEVTSA